MRLTEIGHDEREVDFLVGETLEKNPSCEAFDFDVRRRIDVVFDGRWKQLTLIVEQQVRIVRLNLIEKPRRRRFNRLFRGIDRQARWVFVRREEDSHCKRATQ